MRGRMENGAGRCGFGWGITRLTPLSSKAPYRYHFRHMQLVSTYREYWVCSIRHVGGDTVLYVQIRLSSVRGETKRQMCRAVQELHGEIKASKRDTRRAMWVGSDKNKL